MNLDELNQKITEAMIGRWLANLFKALRTWKQINSLGDASNFHPTSELLEDQNMGRADSNSKEVKKKSYFVRAQIWILIAWHPILSLTYEQ